MKKKIGLFFIPALLLLCSCGNNFAETIDGYAEAENARTLYTELNSGHIVVTDTVANRVTQDFSFRYDSDGDMIYSYMGTDGETVYYEFHNGYEMSYTYDNADKWTQVPINSDEYIVYSKSNPSSLTSKGMLFLNGGAINTFSVTNEGENTIIKYEYNTEALGEAATAQLGDGKLTEFSTTFTIDGNGYCTLLLQDGKMETDGKISEVHYKMEITKMNQIGDIGKPTPAWEKDKEE